MESLFSRIIVTGKDRASFLHNFCTNNIRGLEVGQALEAFFTDARARVLGFGYIIALESRHEIWQPRANADRLLKHLSRYVIREEVSFLVLSDEIVTARRLSNDSALVANGTEDMGAPVTMLQFSWSGQLLLAVIGQKNDRPPAFAEVLGSSRDITSAELETLRIAERMPAAGTDLTDDHMAPEAGRNATAISYTKGCYLGQEPIARLDAMGHVNRLLRCIRVAASADVSLVGADVQSESGASLGIITSSAVESETFSGLAIVKLSSSPAFVVLPDGQKLAVISVE